MAKNKGLADQVRSFGADIANLFNGTVSSHVRLSTVETSANELILGYDLDKLSPQRGPGFKVGASDAGFPSLYFRPYYQLSLDPKESRYLTVDTSVFLLATDEQMTNELLHIDFERDKGDGYPDAHLQINAESEIWRDTLSGVGKKGREFSRLHFPVGGRRFRPTVEDIIEFLIVEKLVKPLRPEAECLALLAESRAAFERKQLRAAIRSNLAEAKTAVAEFEARGISSE